MPIDTENYASPSAYFALPERENREGSWIYCLSRLSDKEEYTTKSATFISLPQKYDECFEVNNYLLFKNESIAPDPDRPIISYTSINPSIHSNYYIGFCGISKLKDTDKSYEYEIKIRTQTGLTKYETVGTFISQDDEKRNRLWTFQEPVDFSDYENGEYARENSLVLTLIDVEKSVVNDIAKDLCAFFHQESVLVTESQIQARFIRETLDFNDNAVQANG